MDREKRDIKGCGSPTDDNQTQKHISRYGFIFQVQNNFISVERIEDKENKRALKILQPRLLDFR